MSWTLFPHVIFRTTGFPWEQLDGLRLRESALHLEALCAAEDTLEALRTGGPRLSRPSRSVLAAIRGGRVIAGETPEETERYAAWNAQVGVVTRARDALAQTFTPELERTREALRTLTGDARFQESLASSSPPVFLAVHKQRWDRRLERQVASYVQRLCAKNETMSFFGPINYATLAPGGPDAVGLRWSGPEHLAQRRTHVASWIVRGLLRTVPFLPEVLPWLVLRRRGMQSMPLKAGAPLDLLARLVAMADGAGRAAVLAERLETPAAEVFAAVRDACERGLLTHQLEVPSSTPTPVYDFLQRLAAIPGASAQVERLGTLLEHMDAYGRAPAAEKVRLNDSLAGKMIELWGVSAKPSGGPPVGTTPTSPGQTQNFYTDRLPLREECCGDVELTVSGARARELQDRVVPFLDLLRTVAERTRAKARAELAKKLGVRSTPLWKVASAFSADRIPYDTSVADALAARAVDASARELDLEGLVPPTPAALPIICSLDVLIGAASVEAWSAGHYELIAGDVHDAVVVGGWALQFHPERERIQAELARDLAALHAEHPMVTVLASRRTGLLPVELPGPVSELAGVSGRASPWRLPFDDLMVESDGVEARLVSRALGCEVALHNGELESLPHTAFALPRLRALKVDLGAHTPRLTLRGLVVQREQWRLSDDEMAALRGAKGDTDLFLAMRKLARSRGIPALTFAKFDRERKPVLVDLDSCLNLRVFQNLLRQREGVVLSQMRPGPEQLWLRGPLGRHTAELRLTYFMKRGDAR